MSVGKMKILINYLLNEQFNYYRCTWTLPRSSNNIRMLPERRLRLIYNDEISSIQELPDKDGSVSIHCKNKQVSQTKMFTIKDGFSPGIASEIFARETVPHYSLKRRNDLRIPLAIHTMYHSDKSISFLAPKK